MGESASSDNTSIVFNNKKGLLLEPEWVKKGYLGAQGHGRINGNKWGLQGILQVQLKDKSSVYYE